VASSDVIWHVHAAHLALISSASFSACGSGLIEGLHAKMSNSQPGGFGVGAKHCLFGNGSATPNKAPNNN
jgi:hypothetical protein